MGVYQELINFDEVYANQLSRAPTLIDYQELENNPLFSRKRKGSKETQFKPRAVAAEPKLLLNTLNDMSEVDKETINRSIYTRYSNDSIIESIPSCECREGGLKGRFRIGVTCLTCGKEVKNRYDDDIQSVIWMKAPQGVRALINPIAWSIISKRFSASARFDTIRWLCDTAYVPLGNKTPGIISVENTLNRLKISRGLNSFYDNFDTIIEILVDARVGSTHRAGTRDEALNFIKQNRNSIFCQYLPLPNKLLMVLEKTNFGTYIDRNITDALDALWSMTGIDNELRPLKTWQKENRTIKAIYLLQRYHSELIKKIYMKKEGLYREHLYAARSNNSFRCVISSLTDVHRYDEIKVPWGVGVTVLRHIIVNKLWNRGWAPKDIIKLLKEYELKYHPVLADLFKEIISESKYGGIVVIGVRNPSLKRGSMQRFIITEVKDDPNDVTVGISILVVGPLGADFDGEKHCRRVMYIITLNFLNCWDL